MSDQDKHCLLVRWALSMTYGDNLRAQNGSLKHRAKAVVRFDRAMNGEIGRMPENVWR